MSLAVIYQYTRRDGTWVEWELTTEKDIAEKFARENDLLIWSFMYEYSYSISVDDPRKPYDSRMGNHTDLDVVMCSHCSEMVPPWRSAEEGDVNYCCDYCHSNAENDEDKDDVVPSSMTPESPVPPPLPKAEWYYSRDGKAIGPVPIQAMQYLAKTGGISPTDLIWKQGMVGWQAAGLVDGIFRAHHDSAVGGLGESSPHTPPREDPKAEPVKEFSEAEESSVPVAGGRTPSDSDLAREHCRKSLQVLSNDEIDIIVAIDHIETAIKLDILCGTYYFARAEVYRAFGFMGPTWALSEKYNGMHDLAADHDSWLAWPLDRLKEPSEEILNEFRQAVDSYIDRHRGLVWLDALSDESIEDISLKLSCRTHLSDLVDDHSDYDDELDYIEIEDED